MAKKGSKKNTNSNKKEACDNKGFRNVPLTTLKIYNDLKDKHPKKTDSELFTLLVKSFNGDKIESVDTTKFTEEIETLHNDLELKDHAITKLNQEIVTAKDSIELLNGSVKELIEPLGSISYTDAVEKIKALVLNGGGASLDELNQAKQLISEQQIKITALETVSTQVNQINTVIGPAIIELGFKTFDEFVNQYKSINQTVNTLSRDNKTLTDKLAQAKPGGIELIGKQFVADVSDENFAIVKNYAPQLYTKKIITGDKEKLPNEVINWAIKFAMRATFGKLETA